MSGWTHAQCERCWIREEGTVVDGRYQVRVPSRLVETDLVTCCFCGELTISGIWRRADPETVLFCGGHEA